MSVGSVAGGLLGARLSVSPAAKQWIVRLLILVIGGELIHHVIRYSLKLI